MNTSTDNTRLDTCAVRVVDAPRVQAVREQMPADSALGNTAAVFGLLADPGRLRLLVALIAGEMCVCDLALACDQSESSVSHALRLLRAHHVVRVRREGRRAFYSLEDAHVRMLLDLAMAHIEHSGAGGVLAPVTVA